MKKWVNLLVYMNGRRKNESCADCVQLSIKKYFRKYLRNIKQISNIYEKCCKKLYTHCGDQAEGHERTA